MGGIYTIINTRTGEKYIGSAKKPETRCYMHFWLLSRGRHHSKAFQAAYDRDGRDAFISEVIEQVANDDDLITREQHHIDVLKPVYNISPTAGNQSGYRHSEETRAKLREKWANPERRARISALASAQWSDPEGRKRKQDGLRRACADPQYRAKQIARAIEMHQDAAYHDKFLRAVREAAQRPDVREKQRAKALRQWSDPAHRENISRKTRARYRKEVDNAAS